MSQSAGTLYVVATPLGNLGDMAPRAVEVLKQVAVIAAEDTRHSAPLLRHFGITTPAIALHEHNEDLAYPRLIKRLVQGESVAVISDAGTPLISDPGYRLVREAHRHGIRVVPIPGPSAGVAALSAAGLPTDRYLYEGFLPAKAAARRQRLQALAQEARTMVFYESPHRIVETLQAMVEVLGADREAVIARELTKTFETIRLATLAQLYDVVCSDPYQQKGEFVILVHGAAPSALAAKDEEAVRVFQILAAELPASQAISLAAKVVDVKKNHLYRLTLRLGRGQSSEDEAEQAGADRD